MSPSLRIACLSHLASTGAPTGAERSLAELAVGLAGRGHRVLVVAPGPWVMEDELRAGGVDVACVPSRSCWLTYWEDRPWPVAAAKWVRHAWPQVATRRLTALLATWRPDVVHVNCLPHLRGAAAARRSGRPWLWHLREILPPGPRRRFFARRLAASGARLVAVSRAVAAWLEDEGLRAQVTVVHNGTEMPASPPDAAAARAALGVPPEGTCVGFVGQLLPHKGTLAFVRAAARAMAEAPGLRALLAGAGAATFRREIEVEIAGSGLPDRFVLLPPRPSGRDPLAASDLVAVPTLTPDPLPRTVMEAMALGRPVVAFPTGGIPEMVDAPHTGLLVPTGDEGRLAAAFADLARDPARRAAMGGAARERCRAHFSLDRHLDRMEELVSLVHTGEGAGLPSA
ncbi:MAG: glycosyltransferase family 4 protein [Thermoanaerobaculaceae bacterium]|nr:glycosyltransferase family 4 protein [Thermoanaerobaculaceae bacterium]